MTTFAQYLDHRIMIKYIVSKIDTITQELKKELLCHLPLIRPRKLLFDHIPKCGGSTLNNYLEKNYPKSKTFSINGLNPRVSVKQFIELTRHERYKYHLIKGHAAHSLLDYVHPDCLKITVLRDPIDRIVSHYFYAKKNPNHYLYLKILESRMSLEEYATSDLSGELCNWYTIHFSGLTITDAESNSEKSVKKALEILLGKYNIIGFLDDYENFTKALYRKANLRYEYFDNRINITKDRPKLHEISESTINKIAEVNHLDIDLYNRLRVILKNC